MERIKINQLIMEKIKEGVSDNNVMMFIEDILIIERDYRVKRGKLEEYEKALAKYVRIK